MRIVCCTVNVAVWAALLVSQPVTLPAVEKRPAQKNAVPVQLTEAALELHRQCIVIDGHNDLPWTMRKKANSSFDEADISQPQPQFHTDIPRLRQGGVGCQHCMCLIAS